MKWESVPALAYATVLEILYFVTMFVNIRQIVLFLFL